MHPYLFEDFPPSGFRLIMASLLLNAMININFWPLEKSCVLSIILETLIGDKMSCDTFP